MPKAAIKSSSLYDVHPGVAMAQKWIAELKPKTGRSLEEWIALVKKEGPKDYQARRAWLKSEHKLGTNSAWWIAERADGKGGEEDSPEKYLATAAEYVEEQYSGKKSTLRPIFEELLVLGSLSARTSRPAPAKRWFHFTVIMCSRRLSPPPTRESISGFVSRRIRANCLSASSIRGALPRKIASPIALRSRAAIISTPTSRNGFAQPMTSTSELVCLTVAPSSRNQE
jgi:hypothetical protein